MRGGVVPNQELKIIIIITITTTATLLH